MRIVEGNTIPARYGDQPAVADEASARAGDSASAPSARRETPVPVVLTRFAAQNLYAPLRTVEPLAGVMRVNLRRDLDLGTLMPTLPVRAVALASWRLEDQWVTAVRLTNNSAAWTTLDPRVLQGDFLTATFQHEALGPTVIQHHQRVQTQTDFGSKAQHRTSRTAAHLNRFGFDRQMAGQSAGI